MTEPTVPLRDAQARLRAHYKTSPRAALVTDHARTDGNPADPFHATVTPAPEHGVRVPVGIHRAIGGLHDAPTPGDLLCAALAACQDSAIRIVADVMGIELLALEVEVTGDVDVRGAMGVDRDVPVGFQSMQCRVRLRAKDGTSPALLEKLRVSAERSCIVTQTLRAGVPVATTFDAAHA